MEYKYLVRAIKDWKEQSDTDILTGSDLIKIVHNAMARENHDDLLKEKRTSIADKVRDKQPDDSMDSLHMFGRD